MSEQVEERKVLDELKTALITGNTHLVEQLLPRAQEYLNPLQVFEIRQALEKEKWGRMGSLGDTKELFTIAFTLG